MQSNSLKRTIGMLAAAGTVLVLGVGVSGAATAAEPADAEAQLITIPMQWSGTFDPVIAAANGFEVRTTSAGQQYTVPTGTPEGSYEGSIPEVTPDGEMAAFGTIRGDCGLAYIFLSGNYASGVVFETGYILNKGVGSLGHAWLVSVESDTGEAGSYDLTGFPTPIGASAWEAVREVEESGFAFNAENYYGYANTTRGGACYSGGPIDSWPN